LWAQRKSITSQDGLARALSEVLGQCCQADFASDHKLELVCRCQTTTAQRTHHIANSPYPNPCLPLIACWSRPSSKRQYQSPNSPMRGLPDPHSNLVFGTCFGSVNTLLALSRAQGHIASQHRSYAYAPYVQCERTGCICAHGAVAHFQPAVKIK